MVEGTAEAIANEPAGEAGAEAPPPAAPPEGAAPAGGGEAIKKPMVGGHVQSLDFILDIPLKVTVELGRTKMLIRDILQLTQGSVVELSKFAGEPLEVLVNEKLVARGEVVVVNEKFGIRLTDIISPVERIEQLK
ncbi:MAG: flagellar motor switch protein FliN [Deltaproteobacteria bacterium]|nr:flagellar motor switch protein FliN [Deltaproteobacteria bacterium]